MDPPRVLLIGDAGVGKHLLLSLITGCDEPKGQPSYPWRLDTKYYTADVAIEVRGTVAAGDGAAAYEAVLLVFDSTRQPSFDSLQQWWRSQGQGAEDVPIKLAVAAKAARLDTATAGAAAGEAGRPAWLEAAHAWCGEQLIEYVESSTWEAERDAAGQQDQKRGLEAEASGVARIVEALQANMWPGMQLKPGGRDGGADGDHPRVAGDDMGSRQQQEEEIEEVEAEQEMDIAALLSGGEFPLHALLGGRGSGGAADQEDQDQELEQELQRLDQLLSNIASGCWQVLAGVWLMGAAHVGLHTVLAAVAGGSRVHLGAESWMHVPASMCCYFAHPPAGWVLASLLSCLQPAGSRCSSYRTRSGGRQRRPWCCS